MGKKRYTVALSDLIKVKVKFKQLSNINKNQ